MDTLKAILNQILLFFDDVAERLGKLPAKGRRRVMLLSAVFLLLVLLLLILCVSSCRSTGQAVTAQDGADGSRTRVRGFPSGEAAEQVWGDTDLRISAEAYAVNAPDAAFSWPPADDPGDEPEDVPDEPIAPEETPAAPAPNEPAATPGPTAKFVSLKKHDKSDAVTNIQNRLMELGYLDIDEPTNYFGSSTEAALILFQRQHDLKQDGIAGSETQALLFSKEAEHYCLKEGAEGEDVKALQEQLVDLGYMAEKDVDRVYGPKTLAAVEAFQKRNGLHVDGLAGEKTLELLYSDDAKVSRDLQKRREAESNTPKPTPTKKTSSKTTAKPGGKKTATPKPTKKATATPKKDTRVEKFIAAAQSKIGCEYVLGAKGPNKFDCSGFVYWCLRQAGVSVTRLNALGYSNKSSWKLIESIGGLKKGDILFFRSDANKNVNHTGIYVGGGNMIDASSGNGKVVKRPISAYFKRNFVCARRPWRE